MVEKNDSSSDSSDDDETHIELHGAGDLTFQVGGKRQKLDDDKKDADSDDKDPDTQKLIDLSGKRDACLSIELIVKFLRRRQY